jgi:phosphoribosylformylglycinamidine cyclo-ligase
LASSGPHSNGYSLVRKILEVSEADLNEDFGASTLGETLLQPTRIYVKSILQLMKSVPVKALSHITGGGLLENLPRVLPEGARARIDTGSWQWPEVFEWLQRAGNVNREEMYRTFNCGVGMVLCVAEADAGRTVEVLTAAGETAWCVGRIEAADDLEEPVILVGA